MRTPKGVFYVMGKEDLTTLEVFYSQRENTLRIRGMKEWDDDIPWDRYMTDFTPEDILTDDYRAVGTKTLRAILHKQGLQGYLEQIEQLLREGKHHGIEFYYNRTRDIRVMYCKHVNTPGIRNRRHALRAGAMRRHELNESEMDVIIDGLNISRAMAFKNAIANIPYGGSKILVQCNEVKLDDFETMGFLAYVSDRSRSFTGTDMNIAPEMGDIMWERFSKNFVGGRNSPMRSSGIPTGYGEYLAIKEACDFVFGSKDLSRRRIAIQGLGEVGTVLAENLLHDSAHLVVTDKDASKVQRLQEKYGRDLVHSVAPEDIYTVDADVLSPCAMGGVVTEERIPRFTCKIIMGAANNQLKANSKEGEIELAKKLADAGILFVVDWAHNTGGVIRAWAEWVYQEEATFDKIRPRVELVCRDNLRKLLEEAKRTGRTPTELVYEKVEKMVYSGAGFSEAL